MKEEESATEATDAPTRVQAAKPGVRTRVGAFYRKHRILSTLCTILVLALLAAGVDFGVLMARPERFNLQPPTVTGSAPETWLVVGTDSREHIPGDQGPFGTVEQAGEGSRADVIALLRFQDGKLSVALLPRDLTIGANFLEQERLTTSYLQGPQHTADLLCANLGVPISHLISVNMAQFAKIIDSLGGVDLDIPEPVRDAYTGLNLEQAGPAHLDGVTALALVRSRHPEVLRDGTWVALSEEEGAKRRTQSGGTVMRQAMTAARNKAKSPLAAHSLAHQIAGNTGLDEDLGLLELLRLARAASASEQVDVVDVPGPIVNNTFIALPTEDTYRVLSELGYTKGTCTPAS
ncbi:Putative transcriptional regulator yvhJ [Actinomyces bovis]|uniref:Transcriptional regulator yvhJ n=1 Tax=Actinomyces bovis TaxID=1658 RepID=A0ABY1VLL3_9ACTO|nr:LCP family protein [Actinomyces bovis]SPT52703.1 Putative transcriptional regulator yvhJ [Actinomyces bovis]VEG54650.1 Putative transcriptional regulator yvhJ [Actinomyces israelii]